MENKNYRNPEDWANEVFANMMFHGTFNIVRNFFYLLLKLNAVNVLVFLHCRFGTRMVSMGSLIWGWVLLSLIWTFETLGRYDWLLSTGAEPVSKASTGLFWMHIILLFGFGIWRIYEANRNLRRSNDRAQIRHGDSSGKSLLWLPVRALLLPTGLIHDGDGKGRWYQLSYYKFLKWVEPLLIFFVGTLFQSAGFTAYGMFLMICAGSVFLMLQMEESNYYQMKQRSWDAKVIAELFTQSDTATDRADQQFGGMVVQAAMIKSDAEFADWKREKANTSMFHSEEPPLRKLAG